MQNLIWPENSNKLSFNAVIEFDPLKLFTGDVDGCKLEGSGLLPFIQLVGVVIIDEFPIKLTSPVTPQYGGPVEPGGVPLFLL